MRRNLIVAFIIAILCGSIAYNNYQTSQAKRLKPPTIPADPAPQQRSLQPSTIVLKFANDATAGKVVREVERMIRPARAAFAISGNRSPRLACVFVENPERFFRLDIDLDAGCFPVLKEMNFAEPPEPLARTISRYKSVSKTAMDYDFDSGDRLMVLLCPAEDWEKLKLECLRFSPAQGPSKPGNKPQF